MDKNAKVKKWYIDNKDSDEWHYATAFYWTMLNYVEACRISSTGIVSYDTTMSVYGRLGCFLVNNIPLFGS